MTRPTKPAVVDFSHLRKPARTAEERAQDAKILADQEILDILPEGSRIVPITELLAEAAETYAAAKAAEAAAEAESEVTDEDAEVMAAEAASSRSRIDHKGHNHENTKAARSACRKALREFETGTGEFAEKPEKAARTPRAPRARRSAKPKIETGTITMKVANNVHTFRAQRATDTGIINYTNKAGVLKVANAAVSATFVLDSAE